MIREILETIWYIIKEGLGGDVAHYLVLAALALVASYGLSIWIGVQHAPIFLNADYGGMITTALSYHVPWGMYIAFFIFWVGVAAAGVVFGLAAYVFKHPVFKKVAVLGEGQAVAALVIALMLVFMDVGRPIRTIFKLALPIMMGHPPNIHSMFDWDFIVLNTYLIANLLAYFYTVHRYRRDLPLPPWWSYTMVILGPLAIGIHTVTAFISQALTARPIWNSPLLAPRYVATAFAAGPALLILALMVLEKKMKGFKEIMSEEEWMKLYKLTLYVVIASTVVGLYFTLSEAHEVYWYTTEPLKLQQANILFKGIKYIMNHYHNVMDVVNLQLQNLPPAQREAMAKKLMCGLQYLYVMTWGWIILGSLAVLLATFTRLKNSRAGIAFISILVIIAVIMEKTMTVLLPAYIPDTLGVIYPYIPTPVEIAITVGAHALGFLAYVIIIRAGAKAIARHYGKGHH